MRTLLGAHHLQCTARKNSKQREKHNGSKDETCKLFTGLGDRDEFLTVVS